MSADKPKEKRIKLRKPASSCVNLKPEVNTAPLHEARTAKKVKPAKTDKKKKIEDKNPPIESFIKPKVPNRKMANTVKQLRDFTKNKINTKPSGRSSVVRIATPLNKMLRTESIESELMNEYFYGGDPATKNYHRNFGGRSHSMKHDPLKGIGRAANHALRDTTKRFKVHQRAETSRELFKAIKARQQQKFQEYE